MSSPPTHDHAIARLGGMVHQLMGLINKAAGAGTLEMMNTHQLTLPQMVALQVLRYEGPLSTLRLMDDLRLSASATSHLVDRLVEKGWVTRRENADDRRQRQLEVTPAAIEMLDAMAEQRAIEFQVAFAKVDPDVRDRLADAFEEVITQLKSGGSS
ncbi:MAG: MarR family transcriptional regulator [Pseudomonadota bacterium]|nr:MarR family transcriptional regulator [Pseudomonadota bacterium]